MGKRKVISISTKNIANHDDSKLDSVFKCLEQCPKN